MSDLKHALDEFSRVPTDKNLEDVLYAAADISDIHTSWIGCALMDRKRQLNEIVESYIRAAVEETENAYEDSENATKMRIKRVLEKIRNRSEESSQDLMDVVCKLFSDEFSLS